MVGLSDLKARCLSKAEGHGRLVCHPFPFVFGDQTVSSEGFLLKEAT